jgi:alkaline phosphatase
VSIVGTIDDAKPGPDMRDKVGVYNDAGYPNYPDADKDGYPPKVDVSKRLAMFYGNTPDYYETFRPHLDGPNVPAVKKGEVYVANEQYKAAPGAVLRPGNLPRSADSGTHTADDALVTAMGPGSDEFHGFMENVEVFRVMVSALGLGHQDAAPATKPAKGQAAARAVPAKAAP